MAAVKKTKSLTTDFGSSFNSDNWRSEINASTIITQIDDAAGGIRVNGDVIDTWFKEELSAGDQTTFDGLPASHDSVEALLKDQVENSTKIGESKTDFDGVWIGAQPADKWGYVDYAMPEDYHISGVSVQWKGMFAGDYAWLAVIHPSGTGSPAVQANAGQATIDMGATLAPYYDPASGAAYLEVWDETGADPILKEVRKIVSKAGNVITVDANFANNVLVTWKIRARYNGFSPVRGTDGVEGGLPMLGDSSFIYQNTNHVTSKITAGLVLSARLRTVADVGNRDFVVGVIFRKPW